MLHQLKPKAGWIAGLCQAAALLLVVTLVGCGGSEKSDERVAVRTPKTAPPATTVELPPPPPATPAVTVEPEVVPEPEPPVTYEVAEAAYMERRYHDAVGLFERYSEEKSNNPWGFYMLGLSYWKSGDNIGAEQALVRALELDPNHVKSYLNLGRVLLDMHRPAEALEQIDKAVVLDSESSDVHRLRARALRQNGETGDAIDAYRLAIRLDGHDTWSMNNLALIYIELGRFDEALPALARAVELRNDTPIFFNNLGMALEGTGRFRDAEKAYRIAVDIDKSYFKAGINMDRVALVIEDPDIEPVDLELLAKTFVDEVARWSAEVAVREEQSPGDLVSSDDPQIAAGDVTESVETNESVVDSSGTGQTP